MNNKVNELIPKALTAIKDCRIAGADGTVEKEYKGYIASMGASIIQSGLIATLAFYSNEQSQAEGKRLKLLEAIKLLIAPSSGANIKLLAFVLLQTGDGKNKTEIGKIEKQISDALIALKLALRTFKQDEA